MAKITYFTFQNKHTNYKGIKDRPVLGSNDAHTTAQGANQSSVLAILFQMVKRMDGHSMTSRKRLLEGLIRGNIVRGSVQTHIWKSLAS